MSLILPVQVCSAAKFTPAIVHAMASAAARFFLILRPFGAHVAPLQKNAEKTFYPGSSIKYSRLPSTFPAILKSRRVLLAGYLLLAWIASIQQWSLKRPGDPYTHYNNYVIFRQAFFHLAGHQDLYIQYLAEHWDYFRYSPSFALAFGAFAWMPDLAGLLLWNTLNAGVLFLGWMMLPVRLTQSNPANADRRGSGSGSKPDPTGSGIRLKPDPAAWPGDEIRLAAAWFVAVEVMTALQNAQSNVLIAGLLLLAFGFLERRRMALASLMIVAASFIKPFGLVAFSLFLFYPQKKKFILSSVLWTVVVALLPLVVVSPGDLLRLYGSWWRLLSMDFAESSGLSVMAWLQSWFHVNPPKTIVTLVGIALFCWPLTCHRALSRLQFPAADSLQRADLGGHLQSQGRVVHLRHRDLRRGPVVLLAGEERSQHRAGVAGVHLHQPVADRRVPALPERESLRAVRDQSGSLHPDLGDTDVPTGFRP